MEIRMNEGEPEVALRPQVSGMACTGCVSRVEDALCAVPGVKRVRVDLAAGEAALRIDPVVARLEALVAAVERAGYRASLLDPNAGPRSAA